MKIGLQTKTEKPERMVVQAEVAVTIVATAAVGERKGWSRDGRVAEEAGRREAWRKGEKGMEGGEEGEEGDARTFITASPPWKGAPCGAASPGCNTTRMLWLSYTQPSHSTFISSCSQRLFPFHPKQQTQQGKFNLPAKIPRHKQYQLSRQL